MNIDDEIDNDFSGQGNLLNFEDDMQVKILTIFFFLSLALYKNYVPNELKINIPNKYKLILNRI